MAIGVEMLTTLCTVKILHLCYAVCKTYLNWCIHSPDIVLSMGARRNFFHPVLLLTDLNNPAGGLNKLFVSLGNLYFLWTEYFNNGFKWFKNHLLEILSDFFSFPI